MKAITEKTAIPISLIIVMIGGIVWLTSVYAKVEANTTELSRVRTQIEIISQIDRRLAVIETELKLIRKQYEEER